jgi:hypothetical protein
MMIERVNAGAYVSYTLDNPTLEEVEKLPYYYQARLSDIWNCVDPVLAYANRAHLTPAAFSIVPNL